jgi:hypothetical protein
MRNILFLAAVLFTINLSASINPSFIKEVNAKSVVVNLSKWSKGNFTITIENAFGEELFKENIGNPIAARQYNLSKMPNGSYNIIIENDQKISIQTIEIKGKEILANPSIREIYKPTFIVENNIWSVQALDLNKNSKVSIYDEDGNVVYAEKIDNPKVSKQFNVEKLSAGNYELTCSIGDKTFSKSIVKK